MYRYCIQRENKIADDYSACWGNTTSTLVDSPSPEKQVCKCLTEVIELQEGSYKVKQK